MSKKCRYCGKTKVKGTFCCEAQRKMSKNARTLSTRHNKKKKDWSHINKINMLAEKRKYLNGCCNGAQIKFI